MTLMGITNNKTGIPAAAFFVPENHDHGHVLDALLWVRNTVWRIRNRVWVVRVVMMDDDRKELLALYHLDRTVHARVCYFHWSRNVLETIRRSCRSPATCAAKILYGTMTLQPPTAAGRAWFIVAVRQLLALFPRSAAAAAAGNVSLSDDSIVQALIGMFNISAITVV